MLEFKSREQREREAREQAAKQEEQQRLAALRAEQRQSYEAAVKQAEEEERHRVEALEQSFLKTMSLAPITPQQATEDESESQQVIHAGIDDTLHLPTFGEWIEQKLGLPDVLQHVHQGCGAGADSFAQIVCNKIFTAIPPLGLGAYVSGTRDVQVVDQMLQQWEDPQ